VGHESAAPTVTSVETMLPRQSVISEKCCSVIFVLDFAVLVVIDRRLWRPWRHAFVDFVKVLGLGETRYLVRRRETAKHYTDDTAEHDMTRLDDIDTGSIAALFTATSTPSVLTFLPPDAVRYGYGDVSVSVCLCVCHVDILRPNNGVDHHATFTRL